MIVACMGAFRGVTELSTTSWVSGSYQQTEKAKRMEEWQNHGMDIYKDDALCNNAQEKSKNMTKKKERR